MTNWNDTRKPELAAIVDDDRTVCRIAREVLQAEGYEVVECNDGQIAIETFEKVTPDIVILDLQMPRVGGHEVCTWLRRQPRTRNVPVLVMTGLDDSEAIEHAYEVGANDFLTKPVRWPLFRHRLRYVMRASRNVAKLKLSEDRLRRAQRLARLGYITSDIHRTSVDLSEELVELFAMPPGSVLRDLEARIHPEDLAHVRVLLTEVAQSGFDREAEFRFMAAQRPRRARLELAAMHGAEGEVIGLEGIVQDVTERREAEETALYLASHDPTTGLANRESFLRCLERMTEGVADRVAVLHIDVAGFRMINERFGHQGGDAVLRAIASRLTESVRASDRVTGVSQALGDPGVARVGNDEFLVQLTGLPSPQIAGSVARRLLDAIESPLHVEGHELVASAKIGISLWPDDAPEVGTVVQNAATAVRSAKASAGSAYCFFNAQMNQKAERRYRIESLMRGALERGEFSLHYQPKRSLATGAIAGCEALFRWKNAELGGFVSPAEAIPVAEETGMILDIGRWVVKTACAQAHAWRAAGVALQSVAVNASIRQFREPGFAVLVQRVLLETGLPADALEVEVTESFLADNASAVVMELEALRRAGVRVAIDDFGTGFSSLGYLRHLPFDVLKVDRAFVVNVADDPRSAALMSAILTMARALGKVTVVEGVETQEQLAVLTQQGWDMIQGYVFSKPLPADDFEALHRRHV